MTELALRIADETGEVRDVAVELAAHATVGDLRRALGRSGAATWWSWRTGAVLGDDTALGDGAIVVGDTIGAAPHASATWEADVADRGSTRVPPGSLAEVRVVGGPDAGARFPIAAGVVRVGRRGDCNVVVADPSVSRHLLDLEVDAAHPDSAVVVARAASVRVDGTVLDVGVPVRVAFGAALAAGDSVLSLAALPAVVPTPVVDGHRVHNRPPRRRPDPPVTTITLPAPPKPPRAVRLPLLATLAPLALAGVLAFVVNPAFLAFSVMSPVLGLATWFSERRAGGSDGRAARARYRTQLGEIGERIAAGRRAEVAARRAVAPDLAECAARVACAGPGLWERHRGDPDFATVRLGLADRPSTVAVEVGGDPDDAAAAPLRDAVAAATRVPDVPVSVNLRDRPVLGIAGADPAVVGGVVRSLLTQLVCLHAPQDLRISVIAPAGGAAGVDDSFAWVPHVRGLDPADPMQVAIARNPEDAAALAARLDAEVRERRERSQRRLGDDAADWTPWHVVVLDAAAPLDRAAVAGLLADGGAHGIAVIWVATSERGLPAACRATFVLDVAGGGVTGSVRYPPSVDVVAPVRADLADATRARHIWRDVACFVDAGSKRDGGGLPTRLGLLAALGLDAVPGGPEGPVSRSGLCAAAVAERWAHAPEALVATVGATEADAWRLDLRADGPHGLVAGTTGSGKSELLQTIVASLAVTHPPQRLQFMLVDYKGGSAFADVVALPHVVGLVTDLDGRLAERALASLRAELTRRLTLQRAAGVKDMVEFEAVAPHECPANLVIVIDEFATLVNEVPAFVEGIVDVAQRGRSVGVHLLLATQRPAGAVNDHIRANTLLRIALRVNDEADSTDVIDSARAAHLPKRIPGRAWVKSGPGELTEVQTAFAGARTAAAGEQVSVRVRAFGVGVTAPPRRDDDADAVPTDLARVVAACRDAADELGLGPVRRPWLAPLPAVIDLADLAAADTLGPATAGNGRGENLEVRLGLADLADQQAQTTYRLDLTTAGSVLVTGAPGSGRTTVLRTIAADLTERLPGEVVVYGLDWGGGGLRGVGALASCAAVVTDDDGERLERLLGVLCAELARRRRLLAASGAGSLPDYLARRGPGDENLPHVVVVVDAAGAFVSTYNDVDRGEYVDVLVRLLTEGRGVGLHCVVTADRRGALPPAALAAVGAHVRLRGDEDGFGGFDSRAQRSASVAGRALIEAVEVQVAVCGADPSGEGQQQRLASLGRQQAEAGYAVAPLQVLADRISMAEVIAAGGVATGAGRLHFGLDATALAPVALDLRESPLFCVAGPDGTGRSNVLAAIAEAARADGAMTVLLAPRATPLTALDGWARCAVGPEAVGALVSELTAALAGIAPAGVAPDGGAASPSPIVVPAAVDGVPRLVVVIDDADELTDGPIALQLESLVRLTRDRRLGVVCASLSHQLMRAYAGWLGEVRKARSGMVLDPTPIEDDDLFTVDLPRRAGRRFGPGRGYVVRRGSVTLVQVADVVSPVSLAGSRTGVQ